MRVLMLGWELPPHYTGGLGLVLLELIESLSKNNYQVDVLLPFKEDFGETEYKVISATQVSASEFLVSNGVYQSSISEVDKYQKEFIKKAVELCESNEYDVIHAHDWMTYKAAIESRDKTGTPVVAHIHATEFDRAGGRPGNEIISDIEYYGLVNADKVVTVSNRIKKAINSKYSIPNDRITTVYNRMQLSKFESELSTDNSFPYLGYLKSKGYKIVLSAGRVTMQKGLPFLLQAAVEAIKYEPKLMFMFVGNGDMLDELIEQSAELGLSNNVLFAGYHNGTGKEWRDAFRAADMFVMPSVSEPFGITPMEAMSFGAAAIVSKQTGSSEILKNIITFDFWDRDRLVNSIVSVARNNSLQQEITHQAQLELNNIDWKESVDEIIEVYDSLKKTQVVPSYV